MTLCHCYLRLETLNGNRRFLLTPFWGATQSWGLAQRSSLHLGSGCRDSSFGDPALAGPALPPLLCLPFWVGLLWSRAGVRVCVCGCVCVGSCWAALLVGVSIPSRSDNSGERATKSFQVWSVLLSDMVTASVGAD